MSSPESGRGFTGLTPEIYENYMVPLIFEFYAADLVDRLAAGLPADVLELAAGTGVVTRRMAAKLPERVSIVATDLNQAMLDVASARGGGRPVEWRQADAMELPFPDASFDAVVCQFGVMFFPDKPKAFAEARRVLRPGGTFLFNAWDRIETNELAHAVMLALSELFPADPPTFMERIPHGYHDPALIQADLRSGGFMGSVELTTLPGRSRAPSANHAAVAFCQGTPMRAEIEWRHGNPLALATEASTKAVAAKFGNGPVDAGMLAHVVTVMR